MLTRFLAVVLGIAGLNALALADDYTLGSATFSAPAGWQQIDLTDAHLVLATPEGRERATITITHLDKAPSFDDFQLICGHRYDAERNGLKDLILIPRDPDPHNENGQMTMTFSGEENATTRVFSGLLWIKGNDLITVYVEGVGISADRNSDAFHAITKTLH